jgi:hypothetical protein
MKKTLFILLAAVIFAACAAPPTNREATSTANANKPAETTAPLTEAEAIAKEKEIWQTLTNKNINAFSAMLADDQIYVSGDGVHDRASSIKGVAGYVPTEVVFSDWKFIPIDKDAAVLTYTAKAKGTMDGQPFPEASMHASSVWVNRGGKWLSVFHQDCNVAKQPPPPPAKAPATPTASPGAAASPAATTADAEANEKAVWAALIARRYDVFESYLSTDFIEVEPTGVTDRAASVKGVQDFDLSKSTLSDWKTVKIDNDASIVTYTVHMPGQKPDTEYHSSVWANRNGKWLAVLHHGTQKGTEPAPAKSATTK